MDINVDLLSFQKAIKLLSSIVKQGQEEIFSLLFLSSIEGKTCITACNNYMTVTYDLSKATVALNSGKVALQYDKIRSFVMSCKYWKNDVGCKFIKISDDGDILSITAEHITKSGGRISNLSIPLKNAQHIDPVAFDDSNTTIDSSLLKTGIDRTYYAINKSINASVPIIKNLLVKFDKDNITFAATNGISLSEYKCSANLGITDTILIPHEAVSILKRSLQEDITIFLDIHKGNFFLSFEDIIFNIRLTVGCDFPDYGSLLVNYDHKVIVEKELFSTAVNQLSDTTDTIDNNRISLAIKDNAISMYNDIASVEGDKLSEGGFDYKVDFDLVWFSASIDSIKDEYVELHFSPSKVSSPIVFRSVEDNNHSCLLSPLRSR